jgi:hypothetical protein
MPISDRAKIGLTAFIRRGRRQRHHRRASRLPRGVPCKVVVQNADGTLELQPDDARCPATRTSRSATASRASRRRSLQVRAVLLTFAGADPQKPIVVGWEPGTVLGLKFGSGASHPLIFGDDFSTPGGAFDVLMQAIATAVGTSGSPAGATAAAAAIVTAILAYQASVVAKLSTITKTA